MDSQWLNFGDGGQDWKKLINIKQLFISTNGDMLNNTIKALVLILSQEVDPTPLLFTTILQKLTTPKLPKT